MKSLSVVTSLNFEILDSIAKDLAMNDVSYLDTLAGSHRAENDTERPWPQFSFLCGFARQSVSPIECSLVQDRLTPPAG